MKNNRRITRIEHINYLQELRLRQSNGQNDIIRIRRMEEEEKKQERELDIMRRINAPRPNRLILTPIFQNNPRRQGNIMRRISVQRPNRLILSPIFLNNPRNERNIRENNRSMNNLNRFNNRLEDKKITENDIDKFENEICVIYQENYAINNKICYFPCFHYFHSLCINEYLRTATKCPLCKCAVRF